MIKRWIIWVTLGFMVLNISATFAQEVPFTRGVNLTNWFQARSAHQIQFSRYTLKDFQNIQSLGCDVIRLPINLHAMTNGAPNYELEPLFLEFLDQAVDWSEALGMYLILDNHTFDPAVGTDPNVGIILEKVWTQMATHYKNRSSFILYEVLNEPHDISDQQWNSIQQSVVQAIRAVDQDHFIVIGPADWNSYQNLNEMPVYTQDKLIYTFHLYDPFVFTHQGASWTNPSMTPLVNVPFPYDAANMPVFPESLTSTWIESAYNNYSNTGNVAHVKSLIDIAVQFQKDRNIPIFCGEFGVYIPNSAPPDRVIWYKAVRQYLEENGIPWTSWDYHGGFGLFEEEGNDLFEYDLNVQLLEGMGFNVPPQSEYTKQPETTGFLIYTDMIARNFFESSSGESAINYYSPDNPNNGKYCLRWEDASQYQYIGFDTKPNKDLSTLMGQEYALDLIFRGNSPVTFDLRFVDTDTKDPQDHPWRMRFTIDENVVPFDSRWHHLFIPLSNFSEHGAWEGQWFQPEGKFDWTDIDRLEIVAEHEDLGNATLWFDNVHITNLDTAQVYDDSVFEDLVTLVDDPSISNNVRIYPIPAKNKLVIEYSSTNPSAGLSSTLSSFQLMDSMGRTVITSTFRQRVEIDISLLPAGIYLMKIAKGPMFFGFRKILKK